MHKRIFRQAGTAWLMLVPQLLITVVFFALPAITAISDAFYEGDPFGTQKHYVGLAHFRELCSDGSYLQAVLVSLIYTLMVVTITLLMALVAAYAVNQCRPAVSRCLRIIFLLPYAVAPPVAAMLWRFLSAPSISWLSDLSTKWGIDWNPLVYGKQAFCLVVMASCWQQFSYDFLFLVVALRAVPVELIDAARLDGASGRRIFFNVVWPLITPTLFFLVVMNAIYALFETFGLIQILTEGGPTRSTTTLVYKVFSDGFMGLDFGLSAAQSVILIGLMSVMLWFQFSYLERRVHYA